MTTKTEFSQLQITEIIVRAHWQGRADGVRPSVMMASIAKILAEDIGDEEAIQQVAYHWAQLGWES